MYLIFVSFTLCVIRISYASVVCDPGFVLSTEIATRPQAMQFCQLNGSELASIESKQDADRLLYTLQAFGKKHDYYWISGTSFWKEDESKWWWDNTGSNMTYSEWCTDVGQPQERAGTDNYVETCIALNFRGDTACWHDYPCTTQLPFICYNRCTIHYPPAHIGEFCVFHDAKTQAEAYTTCASQSLHMTLLNVDTKSKIDRLAYYLKFYNKVESRMYWMGLKRGPKGSNQWVWNSGQGPSASWVQWAPGQPSGDSSAECTVVGHDGSKYSFYVVPCSSTNDYICE